MKKNLAKKLFDVEDLITKILNIYKKQLSIDDGTEAILRYSIRLVISTMLSYSLALLLALLFGTFYYVLFIMLTFSTLRVFSGGAHCSNMGNCATYGAVVANILGLVAQKNQLTKVFMLTMIIIAFVFSLWAISKYAPADTPGKPITTKLKKERLRKKSLIVVCVWFLGCVLWYTYFSEVKTIVYASTIGILWQSFTLTKTGYKFCHVFDNILDFIFNKKEESIC